jgi:hypothetical protein
LLCAAADLHPTAEARFCLAHGLYASHGWLLFASDFRFLSLMSGRCCVHWPQVFGRCIQ